MDFSLLNKVSFLYIFVPTTVSIDGPLSSWWFDFFYSTEYVFSLSH